MMMGSISHVLDLVEGLPGSLELLVHGEEFPDPGVHPRLLPDQEDDVLDVDLARPPGLHGPLGHAGDELHHQVLQEVHRLLVGILVVAVTEQCQPELLYKAVKLGLSCLGKIDMVPFMCQFMRKNLCALEGVKFKVSSLIQGVIFCRVKGF